MSWLEAQKFGFLSTSVDKLGSQLVNVLADIMWYISGKNLKFSDTMHIIPLVTVLKVSVSIVELKTAMKQKAFTPCVN